MIFFCHFQKTNVFRLFLVSCFQSEILLSPQRYFHFPLFSFIFVDFPDPLPPQNRSKPLTEWYTDWTKHHGSHDCKQWFLRKHDWRIDGSNTATIREESLGISQNLQRFGLFLAIRCRFRFNQDFQNLIQISKGYRTKNPAPCRRVLGVGVIRELLAMPQISVGGKYELQKRRRCCVHVSRGYHLENQKCLSEFNVKRMW